MYKSSFLVAVCAAGISHGATSVNDQPAIALTLSEAQPLFVSQNRGLIAPRRALGPGGPPGGGASAESGSVLMRYVHLQGQ